VDEAINNNGGIKVCPWWIFEGAKQCIFRKQKLAKRCISLKVATGSIGQTELCLALMQDALVFCQID